MLLVLALVVIVGGGNDGRLGLPTLRGLEQGNGNLLLAVPQKEALGPEAAATTMVQPAEFLVQYGSFLEEFGWQRRTMTNSPVLPLEIPAAYYVRVASLYFQVWYEVCQEAFSPWASYSPPMLPSPIVLCCLRSYTATPSLLKPIKNWLADLGEPNYYPVPRRTSSTAGCSFVDADTALAVEEASGISKINPFHIFSIAEWIGNRKEAHDGTPDWLARDTGVHLRVASSDMAMLDEGYREVRPSSQPILPRVPPEGGLDVIIEATEHWGVEWAAEALAYIRFEESSNILVPCVTGRSGEKGPYQFIPGTWAETPYAHLDPCDLEAATYAAAWFVSEGRWLEWTTWPR